MTTDDGAPTRVLHVTGLPVGGIAVHLRLLLENLDRDRFECSVAATDVARPDGSLATITVPSFDYSRRLTRGAFVHRPWVRPDEIVGRVVRLRRHIEALAPDIVHTHTSPAGMIGRLAARAAGVPVVVHTAHSFVSHDFVPPVRRVLFRTIERRLDRITDHYVVATEAMRSIGAGRGIFDPAKVSVIPHAVDHGPAAPDAGTGVRAAIGAADDDVVVGFVGRFEYQKGCDDLVRILPRLLGSNARIRVVFAGDGGMRAQLMAQVERSRVGERVHWLGWQPDTTPVMEAIDILVMPSRWEAFGLVILEAAAVGTPTVGYGVEGIPEVVVDGETGLLAPAGDREALATHVLSLADDPLRRARMGAAAHRRLEAVYPLPAMIGAHEALYHRLLARTPTPVREVTTEEC